MTASGSARSSSSGATWTRITATRIQDFLDVDPRFGTRQDLVDLVDAAHAKGLRVILDIVFNHSGTTGIYKAGENPPFRPWPGFYEKGHWIDASGGHVSAIGGDDDGVWPTELQADDDYTRAGKGSLGAGDIDDPHAEHKRTDFDGSFRDFNYDNADALDDVARCYKYWIALTDCDGFRIDTLKHVSQEQGRNFCGSDQGVRREPRQGELLPGRRGGRLRRRRRSLSRRAGEQPERHARHRRLAAGPARGRQGADGAVGLLRPRRRVGPGRSARTGTPASCTSRSSTITTTSPATRSASPATRPRITRWWPGSRIQLFALGIPCIYYGTEQAFAGPEKALRDQFLPDYGGTAPDKYLREAMFGPEHPRRSGRAGLAAGAAGLDASFPGFGPFGTVGHHCFDPSSPAFVRIAALLAVRKAFPVLRYGRQYQRQISNFGAPFAFPPGGELIAWSRILDDEEALCVVNGHGTQSRGGQVVVDASLNSGPGASFVVLANSAQAATPGFSGTHPVGQNVPVQFRAGTAFVPIANLAPSEVLVLINRP